MIFNPWNIAEEKSPINKRANPKNATGDVIEAELSESHASYTGDEGGKSSDNGDKPSNNNSFTTVFLIKFMSPVEVLLF